MGISPASLTAIFGVLFAGSAVIKTRSNTVKVGHRAYKFRLGKPVRVSRLERVKGWRSAPFKRCGRGLDGKRPVKLFGPGFVWQCFGLHQLVTMQVVECFTSAELIANNRPGGAVSQVRIIATYHVTPEGVAIALLSGTDFPAQVTSRFQSLVGNVIAVTDRETSRVDLLELIRLAATSDPDLLNYGAIVDVVSAPEIADTAMTQLGDMLDKDSGLARAMLQSLAGRKVDLPCVVDFVHSATANGYAAPSGHGHVASNGHGHAVSNGHHA